MSDLCINYILPVFSAPPGVPGTPNVIFIDLRQQFTITWDEPQLNTNETIDVYYVNISGPNDLCGTGNTLQNVTECTYTCSIQTLPQEGETLSQWQQPTVVGTREDLRVHLCACKVCRRKTVYTIALAHSSFMCFKERGRGAISLISIFSIICILAVRKQSHQHLKLMLQCNILLQPQQSSHFYD